MITIKNNVTQPVQYGSGGSAPTSVCPVGNPIEFVFQAGNAAGNNTPAIGIVNFSNTFVTTDGDYITVNGVTFFCRTTPGLRDFAAGQVPINVAERVYNLFQNDPVLNVNYDFELIIGTLSKGVRIVARKPGTIYNLNIVESTAIFGTIGSAVFPATDSNVGQGLQDFGVYVKVTVDKSAYAKTNLGGAPLAFGNTQYEVIQQRFTAKLNPSNRMAIDIAGALAPYVTTKAPDLWAGSAGSPIGILLSPQNFKTAPEMLVRYYIEYGYEYIPEGETVPTRQIVGYLGKDIGATDEQLYAANSALMLHLNKSRSSIRYWDWWQRVLAPNKVDFLPVKILHNYPVWKQTHIESIELIYFYRLSRLGRNSLAIKWSIQYESGATQVLYGVMSNIALFQGTVYYVEVGYRQLKKAYPFVESSALIARFTAEIVEYQSPISNLNPITEPQSYELRNEKRCEVLDHPQLLWLNPLGGFDSWVFTGSYDKTVGAEVSEYNSNPKFIDTLTGLEYETSVDSRTRPDEIADKKSYGAVSRTTYKFRSAGLDEAHVRWLQESLMPSTQMYAIMWQEYDNTGNPEARYARRVELKSRELELKKIDNYYTVEIELELSLRNQTLAG